MCLSTNPGGTVTKREPILPGPESSDDMVNNTVVTNITDRSKQKEARGQFRDYGGRDKYRHFDEEAAVNPSGKKTGGDGSNQYSRPTGTNARKRAAAGAARAKAAAKSRNKSSSTGKSSSSR